MDVFLTGATGFIGQPLTRALLARGWNVTALVRSPEGAPARRLAALGARIVPGDINDRESVRRGMEGANLVVHNAAWYEYGVGRRAAARMHKINAEGTDLVLGTALEMGRPRTVYVSSVMAYGDSGEDARDERFVRASPPKSPYEASKAEAHRVAEAHAAKGLPLIITCPGAVIGTNDHSLWGYFGRLYVNRLLPPMAWAADAVQSLVHVDDLAVGIALAAERGRTGETYILAAEGRRMRETLATWSELPGAHRVRFFVPSWLATAMFAPCAPLLRMMGLPAFLSAEAVRAGGMNFNYSAAKAVRELGWRYRDARAMWHDALGGEIALLPLRRHEGIVSRLRPSELAPNAGERHPPRETP